MVGPARAWRLRSYRHAASPSKITEHPTRCGNSVRITGDEIVPPKSRPALTEIKYWPMTWLDIHIRRTKTFPMP